MKQEDVEFIALDHPLVQSLIEFCIDSNHIQGQVAVKVAEDNESTPGILFNYRLGYVSGAGKSVTEKLSSLYVTLDEDVSTTKPTIIDTLPSEEVADSETLDRLTSMASDLHGIAEMEAWNQVESFAGEAREERVREVEIKRQHAERHFEEQINEWEERLETYKQHDEREKDMSAPIGNAKRQLESLRRECDEELTRLEEEKHVTPEEPKLVTASLVLDSIPHTQ